MTKSKIAVIIKTNEWKWKNKWFFTCDMDNWDKISVMRDTNTALKVWDEIEYTLWVADEYGVHRITEPSQNKWGKGFAKNYEKDSISMALSYAKDLVCEGRVELSKIYEEADALHQWMVNKYKGETKVQPAVKPVVKQVEIEEEVKQETLREKVTKEAKEDNSELPF